MSDLPPEVKVALNIALALADGHPTVALIGKAIALTGYKVVPIDGAPSSTASAARRIAARWPQHCVVCNKVINDRAHAEACEHADCPL